MAGDCTAWAPETTGLEESKKVPSLQKEKGAFDETTKNALAGKTSKKPESQGREPIGRTSHTNP